MSKKVELLAPAGNYECLVAAVENGADAVYLGGKHFNARRQAENFDDYVLNKSIEYARLRDVNVYLTLNTLISDTEMKLAIESARKAWENGVNAVIVQDIGFASILRREFPEIVLHGSTQMTVHNYEGVKELEEMGFNRVVLARELSLNDIQNISQKSKIEIEAFVHGALCISYSGQCLMSSMIGGRSGNRGMCAQPCRLPYALENGAGQWVKKGYLMSPKDICSIEFLQDIIKSGVNSLKIEGRMKNPEYVATVIKNYRKILDKLSDNNKKGISVDINTVKELKQVFNRGGFSTGYLKGKKGHEMMSTQKPGHQGVPVGKVLKGNPIKNRIGVLLTESLAVGDGIEIHVPNGKNLSLLVSDLKYKAEQRKWASVGEIVQLGHIVTPVPDDSIVYKTMDKQLMQDAQRTFSDKFYKKVPIDVSVELKVGKPLIITVKDDNDNVAEKSTQVDVEKAMNRPLTRERLVEQIQKTGNTPFEIREIDIDMDEDAIISVGEINKVRREAVEAVEECRRISIKRSLPEIKNNLVKYNTTTEELIRQKVSVYIHKWRDELFGLNIPKGRLYIPLAEIIKKKEKFKQYFVRKRDFEIFVALPRILTKKSKKMVEQNLLNLINMGIDGVMCARSSDISVISKKSGLPKVVDFSVNAYNSSTIGYVEGLGVEGVTLSPELTLKQIEELDKFANIKKEVIVFGRIPLMTSEYCPVGGNAEADKCKGECQKQQFFLRDRKEKAFPILMDNTECRAMIFNADRIFLDESLTRFKEAGIETLRIEILDESMEIIEEAFDWYSAGVAGEVRHLGDYPNLAKIKSEGVTRGHFYRGVDTSDKSK